MSKTQEMTYETFRVKRQQIAKQIYECLLENPPKDSVAIHEPDGLGAVGIDYGDIGYILICQES